MKGKNEMSCDITRRHALRIAVQGGLVLVGLITMGDEADAAANWQRAGVPEQFKVGIPTKVTLPDGKTVYILRKDKTHWLAISPRCTHAGAEVAWNPAQKRFVCPLHGATFTADGQNPTRPGRGPLPKLPTQVKGKALQVDVAGAAAVGGKRRGEDDDDDEREHDGKERKGRGKGSDD